MTKNGRGLTLTFMDGSKVSYTFPDQGANAAAKQLKIEELMKNPFVIVLGEGRLTMFPMVNIKSIEMPVSQDEGDQVRLPSHVIRNAKQTRS
jgi:hypothetical protein